MKEIRIRGARTHNLKNVNLDLPRDQLIVITGVSGSGKSSLAFDTLYAEGQRRYVESLTAYARQFLELMEKPDVDLIDGLSPAIAIEQKGMGSNPRSTVATGTEIYDYLRLLFARVGVPYCPQHHYPLSLMSVTQIVDDILQSYPEGTKLMLIASLQRNSSTDLSHRLEDLQVRGFTRYRIDGVIYTAPDFPDSFSTEDSAVEVVVDRLKVRDGIRQRLVEAVELALRLGDGFVISENMESGEAKRYSDRYACPYCGYTVGKLEAKLFSFNSPIGACPACEGLGQKEGFSIEKLLKSPELSLREGAISLWSPAETYDFPYLEGLSKTRQVRLDTAWKDLSETEKATVLWGSEAPIPVVYPSETAEVVVADEVFDGVISTMERRYAAADDKQRAGYAKFRSLCTCSSCRGSRLNKTASNVLIGENDQKKSLFEIVSMPLTECLSYFEQLRFEGAKAGVAGQLVEAIVMRLRFLIDVGLGYLTLGRGAATLSGGESQRIRLAGQIGTRLQGVMYVLDEPSIGLHQSDNDRLLQTLKGLRDLGNTVIVVEHDEDTIRAADYVVDMGPAAGVLGGEVCAVGGPSEIQKNPKSLTGCYLSGDKSVYKPKRKNADLTNVLKLTGACGNNLKNVDVSIPVGLMTVVTGVSGSGKSTLVNETVYAEAARRINHATITPLAFDSMEGLEHFDKVIHVDQSPIGRTPRSNPATYTGVFTKIRELFAETPTARERGYTPMRFSFNAKGGRCEACEGDGLVKVEMNFLPDVYVPCDVCHGSRYNRETLEVLYKGYNIAEILDLTVDSVFEVFQSVPIIAKKLQTLKDVGLGYIKLGQSATTLSGGEAQRIKLAQELSKRDTGRTLYILDEPTTGLHFHDVDMLLRVLEKLRDAGNTVLLIEHNLDVIRAADWVIDLGPGGGNDGGTVIAQCTPEELRKIPSSKTGQYLGNLKKNRGSL